jgi:hypothetical protein
MGLEALVEPSLTAAALGGRGNAHGSTLVTPVPSVVGEMGLFPDGRIRRALALLDLAHRNLFALRRMRPLVEFAFVRRVDVDRHLFHRNPDGRLARHPPAHENRQNKLMGVAHCCVTFDVRGVGAQAPMPGGSGHDMFGQPGHKMWPMRRRFRYGAARIVGFVVLAGAATGLMLLPGPVKGPPIGGA